ncbi:MAG: transposase [Ignavibacteria bacterium]|nr:transposase [Ignavibacteria bacterium]
MSHSLVKNWLHIVFSTKEFLPLIKPEFELPIHTIFKQILEGEHNSPVRIINGTDNHIHLLFMLHQDEALAKVIKHIKGESAYMINSTHPTGPKLVWQVGYGAFSISETHVHKVQTYIFNQKEHHKQVSYRDEVIRLAGNLKV